MAFMTRANEYGKIKGENEEDQGIRSPEIKVDSQTG